ncbi:MAG TPA: SprB repeat-containing protein, partial [Flavobacterium sp.]|nr:SprB repeat-containing protein [Flavobacterium sp.]
TTLYSENFNSYANGTTTSSLWTAQGIQSGNTVFSVQAGQFQARNIGNSNPGAAVWTSSVINSSGHINYSLSVSLASSGTLNATDYIRVYYKIDGGAETLFSTNGNLSGAFTSATATQNITNANNLQIVIRTYNNHSQEYYFFDNITVTGFSYVNPSLSSTFVDVSCNGGSNGSIDLSVANGVVPFTYAWSTGAVTQDIAGLTAGTYTVTVTDGKNSAVSSSITINQPLTLSPSAAATNISCNGLTDGAVNLTVSGGTTPYGFLWSNGAATEDLAALASGAYTVTVTDANGCTATASATVVEPASLTASAAKTDISCNGLTDGSINITVSGGITPYSYSWSNSAVTEDISALSAGAYTVTVTDANGCTASAAAAIVEPAQLSAGIAGTDVSCNGGSNGSANLTVTGG